MIGLADCNNFYASCERVFNPHLLNKAVIVLSNNDGCVIARSNEAKELGIKMGEPTFKIKDVIKKNKVNVFSTNFSLYGDLSKRVMKTLETEVKALEIYSIDEAFLDLSDSLSMERAFLIRKKVKQWTGIPISIGIAPTKTLAKIANLIAKKPNQNGVFILDNQKEIDKTLNQLPVEDIWGVGKIYSKRLKKMGINTALEFRNANPDLIKKYFSTNGMRLQKELSGEICYDLELTKKKKKTICTSRSFGKQTSNFNILREAISSFSNNCAFKLRKERSCCSKVSVFLTTNKFKTNERQYNPCISLYFQNPTNNSGEIVSLANQAMKEIYKSDYVYKKAGVIVGEISPQEIFQTSLFDDVNREKKMRAMIAVDKINLSMGRHKVRLAAQGFKQTWKPKKESVSPCYTTKFSDILTIHI